jgi:hypothetical protein
MIYFPFLPHPSHAQSSTSVPGAGGEHPFIGGSSINLARAEFARVYAEISACQATLKNGKAFHVVSSKSIAAAHS